MRSDGHFEIGGHVIPPGERFRFDLPVAQLYTHTPMDMSVEVINGRQPGPVLLVCAAIHGDELNGTEVIRRLRQVRSLNRLRGTLVLVPVVNIFGLIYRSRYLPDRRDLNRCFPGTERGSLGGRLAHLFFNEIVSKCTHVIDLHTAAIHRDNQPQIRAALDNPAVKEMAFGFSIPIIVSSGRIEHSLRAEAEHIGIPVITYEAGEALRLDEKSIVSGVRGVVNVMRTLGMLRARSFRTVKAEPFVANSTTWLRAPCDGIFRSSIKLGARVMQDQELGFVTSPFEPNETAVKASSEGIIICVNNLPLVNEGDALFHLARFNQSSAVLDVIGTHEQDISQDPLFESVDSN